MSLISLRTAIMFMTVISAIFIYLPFDVNAGSMNPGVMPLEDNPYGKSYSEWSGEFWRWVLSIPADQSPMFDDTGSRCGIQQNGPVWFLPGSGEGLPVHRTCTIPGNTSLGIFVIGGECSTAEYPERETYAELLKCVQDTNRNLVAHSMSVDGVEVTNLENYRVSSPLFEINYPENNAWGVEAGVSPAVADGIMLILEPLSKGAHKIQFSGEIPPVSPGQENTFVTTATYDIVQK
ncbi:MAG: hypothetical protein WA941_18295 [Nitrososphaeraceae archaeon]